MLTKCFRYLTARWPDEFGQGVVEYAIVLAFVAGVAIYVSNSDTARDVIQAVFADVQALVP